MTVKTINICSAKLNTAKTKRISATKLRGYLGYLFIQDTEFHHHDNNPYRYPLVQYKKIDNELMVLGINEYSKIVFEKISGLKEIVLPNQKVPITSIEFSNITHLVTDDITRYEFQTPWIALNSENYKKFKNVSVDLQYRFLENILIGNFLSALKGMEISIDYKLYASIKKLRPTYTIVHKNPFYSFYGKFITNLNIPNHIGIGNSVSKGFGVIKNDS